MRYSTLAEWLAWQESLHPSKIDMSLGRVREVLQRMGWERPPYGLITVGGTNGKGSCAAMLEAILGAAGYRVGVYTSPHLLRYNERIRIDRDAVNDAELCRAFDRVDEARRDITLTYFEFGTLSALDIFARADLDIVVLEVGMGGRLDAVNVLDADVAVVTTVAIDHTDWLGADRETIGAEKAGIFRPGRPAVYGDDDPPASVTAYARALGAPLYCFNSEFGYKREMAGWSWWGMGRNCHSLPPPSLRGAYQLKNAATALMALALLKSRFPVAQQAVRAGLSSVDLPGRLQLLDGQGLRICDVAHNPQAASALAGGLKNLPCTGRTHAVVGMLAHKDAAGVIREMAEVVAVWHVASLACERGATAAQLAQQVRAVAPGQTVLEYFRVSAALAGAAAAAGSADRIVVFGSFHTVAAALEPDNNAWRRQAGSVQNERVLSG